MAKLKGFFNKILNNNRIFTAEDIGEMSSKEFGENEKAIDYQMSNLGIPRRNDLLGNSDTEFVNGYTRADGTQVKAHYRVKSDTAQIPIRHPIFQQVLQLGYKVISKLIFPIFRNLILL